MTHARRLFKTHGALIAIAVLAYLLLVWAPGSLSAFRLGNLGRYCALALPAMGIGLAWGRGGMLVMGQGVFFGLGGYAMAMHMKLEAAGPGNVPDFMQLYGDGTMPFWWRPFRSGAFTLFAIIAIPAVVSFVLGFAILKRRVKGAYLAILTQALAVAFATLLIATIKQTGGFNGLNTFTTFFGNNLYDPDVKKNIYLITAGLVILFLLILWQVYRSRYRGAAGRHTRRRRAHPLPGLRPRQHQVGGVRVRGRDGERRRGDVRADSRHHLADQRRCRRIDPVDRRCCPRRPLVASRSGTRRDRRRLRPVHPLGAVPHAMDLLPGRAVHPGRPTPPQRRRLLGVGVQGRCGRRSSRCGRARTSSAELAVVRDERGARMTASFLGEDYLEIRNLTVDFDGFKAINGVDLTLLQGRLHFLIGPNGAGKTTLVDALTGLVQGAGEAVFRRKDLLTMKAHEIVRLGIGRTFQTASVFEKLTVLQNLDIAAGMHRGKGRLLLARRQGSRARSSRHWTPSV